SLKLLKQQDPATDQKHRASTDRSDTQQAPITDRTPSKHRSPIGHPASTDRTPSKHRSASLLKYRSDLRASTEPEVQNQSMERLAFSCLFLFISLLAFADGTLTYYI
ncbi:hypothetical protein CFP56_016027, partial [Quercus suber]